MLKKDHALWRHQSLLNLAFPVLTLVFGFQCLRVMIPTMIYIDDPTTVPEYVALGFVVIGVFLPVFLAPLLPRLLGLRRALWVSAGGVALVRFILQLSPDPNLRLWLSGVGVLLFLFFVPIYLGYRRRVCQVENIGIVFLLGLALDTTLHGLWWTYDYAWDISAGPLLVAGVLTAAQLFLLWRFTAQVEPASLSDRPLRVMIPLLGFGMAMFLHFIIWQNLARQATMLGWRLPTVFLLVMVSNAAGLLVGVFMQTVEPLQKTRGVTLIALIGLLIAAWVAQSATGIGLILAHVALAVLIVQIGNKESGAGERPGLLWTATAWGLGIFLFLFLCFFYYESYALKFPFENTILPAVAAGKMDSSY